MRSAARAAGSTASDFITEPVGTRQLERSVYAYAEQAADFSPLAAMIAIAHDEIGTPNQDAAFKPDGGRFRPAWALRPIAGALTPCTLSTLSFPWMEGSVWAYQGPCLLPMLTAPGAWFLSLAKLVQGWFDQSTGRVLGLWFACGAVGASIHPLWTQAAITRFGWRQACLVMGVPSLLMCSLAALLLVR